MFFAYLVLLGFTATLFAIHVGKSLKGINKHKLAIEYLDTVIIGTMADFGRTRIKYRKVDSPFDGFLEVGTSKAMIYELYFGD